MQQLRNNASAGSPRRLLNALLTRLPGAWITPSPKELVTLYRLRYSMALEEGKFDIALIFLTKILEVDPTNLDAKLCKAEIYHRYLRDYTRAVEQYTRIIRASTSKDSTEANRARASLTEIMELLS